MNDDLGISSLRIENNVEFLMTNFEFRSARSELQGFVPGTLYNLLDTQYSIPGTSSRHSNLYWQLV